MPDHSSLSKIHTRLGLPVFRRFFVAITEQCVRAGLVWGEELPFLFISALLLSMYSGPLTAVTQDVVPPAVRALVVSITQA